jgi:alkaline phosphatase D
LTGAASAILAPLLPGCAHRLSTPTSAASPFTLGVASGSPSPDGFVLWTRLAPLPLASDGRGGMSGAVDIRYEIATDPQMRTIVRAGETTADPVYAHAVHLEVGGLRPDRPYWYRFVAKGHASAVGRARTTPAPGAPASGLRFVFASCSHWESGWFSAYRHMAHETPDLVLFLGDYIYEYSHRGERAANLVRRHEREADAISLADYRNRYALYRTDPDLQALHAVAPCLATWDDHEVHNDYANRWSQDFGVSEREFLRRRAAAYRAFYEHMPLRRSARPRGPDMRIFGQTRYGDLAAFNVLDGRQHRSPQPCPTPKSRRGHVDNCADLLDPNRSMLGPPQEAWLQDRFRRSGTRWTIMAQNLLVARLEQAAPNGDLGHFTDGWDGYQANRTRMLDGLAASGARNPVFLAGDIHSSWANDLKADFRNPNSGTIASEFVAPGVTADSPRAAAFKDVQVRNPHIRFVDLKAHGYVSVDLKPSHMETAFRAISDRRDQLATVSTLRRFVVEDGRAGLIPV